MALPSRSSVRYPAIMSHKARPAFAWPFLLVAALVCAVHAQTSTGTSLSGAGIVPTAFGEAVDRDVTAVRAGTESFKVLDNAVAAGYDRNVSQCVQDPSQGGMGFHHKNAALR